jgi:hypothetical protein
MIASATQAIAPESKTGQKAQVVEQFLCDRRGDFAGIEYLH